MALQITQNQSRLDVKGILTSENANQLKAHFNRFFKKTDRIVLNLEGITKMEAIGAYTIEQLYLDVIKSNRIIAIIGIENKAIAKIMNMTRTSYIFSHDRV